MYLPYLAAHTNILQQCGDHRPAAQTLEPASPPLCITSASRDRCAAKPLGFTLPVVDAFVRY